MTPRAVSLAAALILAGCGAGPAAAPDAGRFDPPHDLTAALVDGQHVDLHWTYTATAPGGAFIEFKMGPDDEHFTMLDAAWPGTSSFRHPDVAPDTRFVYRVRSFFGRPSEVAAVDAGTKNGKESEAREVEGPLDGADGFPPVESSGKRPSFAPETAPTNLTAVLSSPTAVELRWRDRAPDEDGYLVETSAERDRGYRICALLGPNAGSFRKASLPERTRSYFRVRAFYYGPSSNLASVQTPPAAAQRSLKSLVEGPGGAADK
jgi:hypothetical protein